MHYYFKRQKIYFIHAYERILTFTMRFIKEYELDNLNKK